MFDIFMLMLSAILIENFIFSKFMGCCPFLGVSEKPDTALGMGCAVTFVMTLASAVTWAVYRYILLPFGLEYLKTIAFILVIAALVQFIEMFLKRFVPALYSALGIFLPLITTNCAVLGAALLNIQNEYSFIESVVYGFSAALGFTLAIVIFAEELFGFSSYSHRRRPCRYGIRRLCGAEHIVRGCDLWKYLYLHSGLLCSAAFSA